MQTKSTLGIIAMCLIASASMILSSCSTTSVFSGANAHYRLDLVKTNNPPKIDNVKAKTTETAATPAPQHGSMVSYQSSEQLQQLTDLLKSDVKQVEKQEKKSDPAVYKALKKVNINKLVKQLAVPRVKTTTTATSSLSSINDQQYDLMRDPKGLFVIWILVLGAAIVLLLLSMAASIFLLFGFITAAAFIVFFTLWVFSITGVPERVA